MFEIKGKITTAICYAKVVEDEAIGQIRRMCDHDLTKGSKVRIMPDVHAGKGCTIGTTMTVTDKICPNIVGVDIGCGMYTVKLQDQVIDFEKIDDRKYQVTLHYDKEDETEILIRVLSFGPMIRVVKPMAFINLIKCRLSDQKSCGL